LFQSINTNGAFQVDGLFKNFALKQKLTLTLNNSKPDVSYYASFSRGSQELVATRSTLPHYIDNNVVFGMNAQNGGANGTQTVDVYIFSPTTDVGRENVGLEVFSPSAELTYASAQKNLNMVDFVDGTFDKTYSSGRTYAAVMSNQFASIEDATGGVQGNIFRTISEQRGMLSMPASNRVVLTNRNSAAWVRCADNRPGCTTGAEYYKMQTNLNRHIIIDVTGF